LRQDGLLLIADEVITGFGRTGRWFAMDHWNVQPDLLIFAKGVTSGYLPLSGVILSRRVHDVLKYVKGMFAHGFTYSGHPTACAVALRNLQILEDEGLVKQAAERGAYLRKQFWKSCAGTRSLATCVASVFWPASSWSRTGLRSDPSTLRSERPGESGSKPWPAAPSSGRSGATCLPCRLRS
jgi:adenosylmethionine-8-amino-7-oxononanoate aminotransferase